MLLLSNITFSQNISKAYELIEISDFEKAMEIFKKAREKKKEPIATKYGMALIYLNEAYRKPSCLKSYKYMNYAEKKLKKSKTKSDVLAKTNKMLSLWLAFGMPVLNGHF